MVTIIFIVFSCFYQSYYNCLIASEEVTVSSHNRWDFSGSTVDSLVSLPTVWS